MDWRGTTSYGYDTLNRVTSISTPDGNTVGYGYDAVGNRTSLTYPSGNVVQYQYDALNRLTEVTDWNNLTTKYTYDAVGNLLGTTNPNNTAAAYSYDTANRLLNITNRNATQVLSGYGYVLDKVGNRIEVESYNEGVQQYRYDKLYRLTAWTNAQRETTQWIYDAVGNRLQQVGSQGTLNYTYDAADEMLTAGTASFAYDGNGNQLTKTNGGTTTNYSWDALNRLTAVVAGRNGTQYQYDGDGNRVSQQISTGTYAYVNDTATALPVVMNENGPDGNISYAYGPSLISASATNLQSFYQFDGTGSVVTVTDQSGFVKAAYQYDPWGTVQSRADLLGRENKYKFIGEAEDPAASLMFLRARFLDSTSGRFLSRDPLGLRNLSGMSSYTYALANPLRLVDPSGLSAVDWDQAPATSDSTPNPTPFAGNAVSGAGIFQDPAVGPAFRAQLKSIVVGEFLGDYINFARDSYTWEKDAFSSSTPTAKRLTDSWDVLSDIAGIAGHDTVGLFMDAIKLAATPEVAK